MSKKMNKKLELSDVRKILGIKRYNKDVYDNSQFIGVAIGLAWTPCWRRYFIY